MAENIINNPPVHLQANLTKVGDMTVGERPTRDRSGKPKMCRIVSVDRVHGLVSVTSEQSKSPNKNSVQKPGNETVQLPVDYYGINTTGKIFGKFPYVGVGERVLVEHVNGDASLPVVVNAYPDEGVEKHLTPTEPYEAQTNKDTYFDDFRSQKTVLPSQHVILHTGTGNYEHSLDGFSVIAQLNPGDYDNPPWRDDYYTGLPENSKNGVPLNCFIDKSTDRVYPIQNVNAQDWIKIHQSNSDNDHHITKRLVKQNGETHNFWGSKTFKNNSLSEDASVDNGYQLSTYMGKVKVASHMDRMAVVRYAKKQIGKHPFSNLTFSEYQDNPKKYKHAHMNNEILYNPNPRDKKHGSGSNKLNFIWTVLNQTDMSVSSTPWSNYSFMAQSLTPVKKGKAGDIVFLESDNYKKYVHKDKYDNTVKKPKHGYHEIPDPGKYFLQPYILLHNYHGYGTKIIGENKKAKNVAITTIGAVYSPMKWYQHPAFFTTPHNVNTGSSFKLGKNNSLRLSVVDPTTTGYHHRNTFYLNNHYGSWRVMGHSITIDKDGVRIDGLLVAQILKPLKDKIRALTKSLNTLVYNLNDRNSRLSQQMMINHLLNLLNGMENQWHDYDYEFPVPVPKDTLIQNCKDNLGKPYSMQTLLNNCGGFVYEMLKQSGYKVPDTFDTSFFGNTDYMTPVNPDDTKRNSIMDYKGEHVAILLEAYHGPDTAVIQAGGAHWNVNMDTIGDSLPTADTDDLKFYNPIPSNQPPQTSTTLPNDNDILNVKDNDEVHQDRNHPITFNSGGASDLTYAVDTENFYDMFYTKGDSSENKELAFEHADLLSYASNIRSYRAEMNSIAADPHVPMDSELAPAISSYSGVVSSAQSLVDTDVLTNSVSSSEMSEASDAESSAASAEEHADYQYIFASASFSSLSSAPSQSSFFSFSSANSGLLQASQPSFDYNSSNYLRAKNNYLEKQNQGLSNKYDKLVSTLKSSGILPKDYK